MPTVLCVQRGDTSREYPLDQVLSIGRAADNAVILEDDEVSRHHALISPAAAGYELKDLGSANGSFVGERPIDPRVPVALTPGDAVRIGPFALLLRVDDAVPLERLATRVMRPPATVVAPARAWLEVRVGGGPVEVVQVGDELTIGRDSSNGLMLDTEFVSRRHLVVRRTNHGFVAADLGSTNKFHVNGVAESGSPLSDGDLIDIVGHVQLRFRLGTAMAAAGAPLAQPDVAEGQPAARAIQLERGGTLTVGRDPASDVHIEHPMVSLQHARLEVPAGAGAAIVEDLGSRNGTFLNGARLSPHERRAVNAGDVLQVGPVRLALDGDRLERHDYSRGIGLTVIGLEQHVSKGLNLLQGISFAVQPQEFVAVVGMSGAGKSTLLGALSGLKPASHGQVLLNGVPLYENYDAFRTIIGYVPQEDILHRELPAGRALGYAAELRLPDDVDRLEREERVRSVVAELGLEDHADSPVGRLSGGQRKRVSIGAELLTQPGLFFLDEATSGLDPGTEGQLMRLLRGLADTGHTVVLITHATKNVMLCDQVLFLAKGGHLAYYGPPDEALAFFGVKDFDEIYDKLQGREAPQAWSERYLASAQHERYVTRRLARDADGAAGAGGMPGASPAGGRRRSHGSRSSWWRQLTVLWRRYADILRRDRIALVLLFLLAPALGSINLIAWPSNVLNVQTGNASRGMAMLFVGSLVPFFVGALTFVREIVKERAIYERERAVSLRVGPYVASKALMAFPMALYHAAALFLLTWLAVDLSAMRAPDLAAYYVTLTLAVWSGAVWGLLISTITRREEQAMMLIVGVVVVQIVFSGGLVPLDSVGVIGQLLGTVTSTAWCFKALVAAAGLSTAGCSGDFSHGSLPGVSSLGTPPERQLQFTNLNVAFGEVFDANLLVCWLAMVLIMAVIVAAIFVLQKRKDLL